MITLVDVFTSIISVLEKETNLKVYMDEVKEGFDKPSFFMQIFVINDGLQTSNLNESKLLIEIVYFHEKENGQLENIEIYEILKKSFNKHLLINDRKILPIKIQADFNGGILSFKFNLEFLSATDFEEQFETMKELEFKINQKKEES